MSIAIWLDDKRPIPPDFGWDENGDREVYAVTHACSAIWLLQNLKIDHISLDHDLGDESRFGTGYDVAKWIEEQACCGNLKRLTWAVHSQNPVGAGRMRTALQRATDVWDAYDNSL